ncbi:MAG: DUF5043 domain-containing protein [Dysgonamonadaceae bacterium]|jgi:hypothetical protein|nr:DUF5043 domain-containing protein [Dysgonamonadaceae bacterium]
MNTIKILSIIGILLFATSAIAQTNLYSIELGTKTILQGNGFTYQARNSGMIILYNTANQFSFPGSQGLKNGSAIPETFWSDGVYSFSNNSDVIENQITTIVRNALSAAERQRIGNHKLKVISRINPDTGVISEVEFRFMLDSPFNTIPLSVYRTIEVNLKNQVKFTPTAKGRQLNFILYAIDVKL